MEGILSGQNLEINISEEELFEKLFNLTSQGELIKNNYSDSKVYQLNEAQILEYTGVPASSGNFAIMRWLEMTIDPVNGLVLVLKVCWRLV